jgi:hypothetical protein
MKTHKKITLLLSLLIMAVAVVYSQNPTYPGQPGTGTPNAKPGDNILPSQQPGNTPVPTNGLPNPQQPGTIQPANPQPQVPNQPGTPGATGNNGPLTPPNQNPGPGNGGFPNNPNGMYPGNKGVTGPTGR